MYQDSDFGKDVLAGVVARNQGDGHEGRRHDGAPADRHRFQRARWSKLHDAGCDAIMMGTIVRDTNIIIQTVRKMNWNVDLVGQFAVL